MNADDAPAHEASEADSVLAALDQLRKAIEENTARNRSALARIERIERQRANGWSYGRIVLSEDAALVVELTTANIQALMQAGCRVRRAEAVALHDEGFRMERIAELFGVTRQRISEIIRDARAEQAETGTGALTRSLGLR